MFLSARCASAQYPSDKALQTLQGFRSDHLTSAQQNRRSHRNSPSPPTMEPKRSASHLRHCGNTKEIMSPQWLPLRHAPHRPCLRERGLKTPCRGSRAHSVHVFKEFRRAPSRRVATSSRATQRMLCATVRTRTKRLLRNSKSGRRGRGATYRPRRARHWAGGTAKPWGPPLSSASRGTRSATRRLQPTRSPRR